MGKQKNILSINGTIYDISAGALAMNQSRSVGISIPRPSAKSIDGFMRRSNPVEPPSNVQKTRQTGHSAKKVHIKNQPSKTLMRSAVTRPSVSHAQAIAVKLTPSKSQKIDFKLSNAKKNLLANKYKHAKQVGRSSTITRFYVNKEPVLTKKTEAIAFKTAPDAAPVIIEQSTVSHPQASNNDIFSHAVSQASSHTQARPKAQHRRIYHRVGSKFGFSPKAANIGASVLAGLVLVGFIAFQNQASINLRIANSKAGIHASLPGYSPGGFAMSRRIASDSGEVTLSYRSNSDNRSFTISQSASKLDSQLLQQELASSSSQPNQSVKASDGATVYLYDDANAAWVDSGLLYKVEGDSKLSVDQLLKIANSF